MYLTNKNCMKLVYISYCQVNMKSEIIKCNSII